MGDRSSQRMVETGWAGRVKGTEEVCRDSTWVRLRPRVCCVTQWLGEEGVIGDAEVLVQMVKGFPGSIGRRNETFSGC